MSLLTDALSKPGPTPEDTAESAITELEEKLDISGELDESSRDATVQTVALDELLLEEFEAARRDREENEQATQAEPAGELPPFDSNATDVLSHDDVMASQSIVLEDLPSGTLDSDPEALSILHDPPTLTDTDVDRDPTLVVMPDPGVFATKTRRRPKRLITAALAMGIALSVAAFYLFFRASEDQVVGEFADAEQALSTTPTSLSSLAPKEVNSVESEPTVEPAPVIEVPAEKPAAVSPAQKFAREPATTDDIRGFAKRAVKTAPQPQQAIKIARTNRENPVFVALTDAYEQFRLGNFSDAGIHYQQVLSLDPNSVDALLGLAALAQREGKLTDAQNFYQMALNLDPKNSIAISGMMSLQRTGATVENESELKSMLAQQPRAAHLHFSLGLHYVTQSRWPDAQQSFFEAVRHDPVNADYAYNLAVSLDQLGQREAAANYYQRAVDLANGAQKFELDVARKRLSTLTAGG